MITPQNKINVPLKGAEDWSCIFIVGGWWRPFNKYGK